MRRSALIGAAFVAGFCQWPPAGAAMPARQSAPPAFDLPGEPRPVQSETHTNRNTDNLPRSSDSAKPGREINTLSELLAAVRRCYVPPSIE
jgi:hypothetical protein